MKPDSTKVAAEEDSTAALPAAPRSASISPDPEPDPARNVYFALGNAELSNEARETIRRIAAQLKNDRQRSLTLIGSTDDLGSKEYCVALAVKRMAVVERELVVLGVPKLKIRKRARGCERTASRACKSDACHRMHRRVEFQLLD